MASELQGSHGWREAEELRVDGRWAGRPGVGHSVRRWESWEAGRDDLGRAVPAAAARVHPHRPVRQCRGGHRGIREVGRGGGGRGRGGTAQAQETAPLQSRAPPAQFTCGTADVYVVAGGVQHPVVALAWVVVVSGDLDEAFVEGEVVSDGVLPALLVVAVVRKVLHDELVDAVQSELLLRAAADRHHDERVVAEGRFLELGLLLAFRPRDRAVGIGGRLAFRTAGWSR